MNAMPNESTCPKCGKPVSLNAFEGLCPECLMQAGFGTVTGNPGEKTPSAFVPPAPEELARHFPQLEILELLGRGGMGAVYKARQTHLDRMVALKILPSSISEAPSFSERFAREARALAKLHHPNIVTLYESGQADELFYFLMEFVDGVNLRQLLTAGTMAPKDALAIVPQICDALQFAHDRGIVHRDIKPENILLSKAGQVKIADFGVAKIVSGESAEFPSSGGVSPADSQTEAGKIIGTPQYMAPEQISHPLEVDHRADIYALGVVFYQMLTGELPAGKFEPPSRKAQIDARLDEVVLRALEKKPELRYQQASVMKTQVETIVATEGGNEKAADGGPRFSRMAIAGACWSPFFFIALAAMFIVRHAAMPEGSPRIKAIYFVLLLVLGSPMALLGLTAPFGTSIFGWIAVAQIRRSAGKLTGLGLAVFDGLLFPLLALDGAIISAMAGAMAGLLLWADRALSHSTPLGVPLFWLIFVALAVLGLAAFVDFLIIRAVWRAVNKPPGHLPAARPAPKSSTSKVIAIGCGVLAGGLVLLLPAMTLIWFIFAREMVPLSEGRPGALWRNTAQQQEQFASAAVSRANASAQNLCFGPVIERVVMAFDENPAQACLNLGSGEFQPPPPALADRIRLMADREGGEPVTDLGGPGDERYDWLKTSGVDLIGYRGADGSSRFKYIGQPPHYQNGWTDFDSVSPGDVIQTLQSSPFFAGDKPNLPDVYINSMNPNDEATKNASYIVFRTHDGDVGVMKVLGTSENPPGVKIRYKLVQSSVTSVTPVSLPPAVSQTPIASNVSVAAFGPVREEVLPMDKNGLSSLFDVDQEKLVPDPGPGNTQAGLALLFSSGLMVSHDEATGQTVLVGMAAGTVTKSIPVAQWETMNVAEALATIEKNPGKPGLGVVTAAVATGKPPLTFLFKTPSGKVGLWQVEEFTENPRGVRIRYKLAQSGG
jgi:predicted Ser/Thr protein kinase